MNYRTVISPWLAEWVTGDSQHALKSDIEARIPGGEITVCESVGSFAEALKSADILITNRFPDRYHKYADGLSWIQTASAGLDMYDLDLLRESDAIVTNASGVHAEPIAEHVLAYMLVFERKVRTGLQYQNERQWTRYQPGELSDKTLCVIGLGTIGTRIAQLADSLGMEVVGSRSSLDRGHEIATEVRGPDDIDPLLSRSHYVVLACPLTTETEGLIGPTELVSMKQESVLINIARGKVVDEDALIEALQRGRIGGAALDVTEEEPLPEESRLWNHPNVLITPHISGLTPRYWERVADIFVENYELFANGDDDEMKNRVV